MPYLEIERLKQLPRRKGMTWQGGFIRLPVWVTDEGEPYRPVLPMWVSLQGHTCFPPPMTRTQDRDPQSALSHLVHSACDEKLAGYRPARIEVNDQALADFLAHRLREAEIDVIYRQNLLGVNHLVRELEQMAGHGVSVPGPLEVPGVSVERMRAFASAAELFYKAAPWRHLSDEDFIHIESGTPEPALRYCTVLGAAGETYGLGFFDSPASYQAMYQLSNPQDSIRQLHYDIWSIRFDSIMELPVGDSDLWLDHQLPAAGPVAYPCALCYARKGRTKRPTPTILNFLESLMRALAGTTEDELDGGR